ncbi:glycosyltransferase family 4 protein [Dyadobacter sp. CY312]|uniref:glycosyltransferase family 4 protein n=1 Tax=Dyadobacter sp. CY312 TaxID=2907303 RepID=UPI001F4725DA|nr:glycosyltransferase family 4 protein [Dyadobacter sp. CY312]MCE7043010.1 glycosyltransferase family 4 protein [Dyadobacter sp. CY312]
MHILLVHQFFLKDNDGGGSRWNEMSRIWVEAGHQVTVLAGIIHYMEHNSAQISSKSFTSKMNFDGVEVISCPATAVSTKGYFKKLSILISFTFSALWAGIFHARSKYDLVIVSSPPLFVGITGIVLSWLKRIPFVFEVRDIWPESAIQTHVLKNKLLIKAAYWLEGFIYEKAQLINVLTPAFREILMKRKKVPAEKLIYIPNAADFRIASEVSIHFDRDNFRKEHQLDHKFVIVYVGAHGIANHLIQILETAELVQDTNAYFLLIGDGDHKKWLVDEAQRRNLKNVRFLDKMAKHTVFEFILASDMGTSVLQKIEIFKTIYSNKTFDYFSCKKPVLMVIDGISRKLVEEADAGIFVEPENPLDFAEKIRYCINNQHLLHQQGENGYRYAEEYFNRDVLAKQYLDYLEEL